MRSMSLFVGHHHSAPSGNPITFSTEGEAPGFASSSLLTLGRWVNKFELKRYNEPLSGRLELGRGRGLAHVSAD